MYDLLVNLLVYWITIGQALLILHVAALIGLLATADDADLESRVELLYIDIADAAPSVLYAVVHRTTHAFGRWLNAPMIGEIAALFVVITLAWPWLAAPLLTGIWRAYRD